MVQFFLSVYGALEASREKFESLGLPGVKFVDRYRGQPVEPAAFEYFELPAVFVQYAVKWERTGRAYNGILDITFHVVTDATWDTSSIAATGSEEGLKLTLFIALLRKVLDNITSENTGKMMRVEEGEIDSGVTNYFTLKYTCMYSDPTVGDPGYIDVLIEKLRATGHLQRKL